MTVTVAVRVPGQGAVLACDSRVTGDTTIMTDSCDKFLICGNTAVVVASHDGALFKALAHARNWDQVLQAGEAFSMSRPQLEWSILGYDRRADKTAYFDSHGSYVPMGLVAAGGCGGTYATGWMDAHPRAKNLAEAEQLAMQAVAATIRRDSACGGRVRVITIPRRRGAISVA